jgi:negative regulator of flagellin synthesis FlgM
VKIENNSIKTVPGANVSETRSRTAEKAAPSALSSIGDNVQLSGFSAQLQSSGEASSFDAARVSQIKQAIAEGQFQINAGAIADRLISSARELVNAQRQG